MKFLYIFPHPDDESFGPIGAIDQQLKQGHQVYLYTLTRGGATKQRHKLGLSIQEMGEIRSKEMLNVEKTVGLTSLIVDDFPDSGLQELDPRILEEKIEHCIHNIKPDIIVSYPVHGISGFHDHLVTHAVVKRVYMALKQQALDYAKRLAFITVKDSDEDVWLKSGIRMKQSPEYLIDCIIALSEENKNMIKKCLDCYATYKETIEKSNVIEKIGYQLYFEIYNESFEEPLNDLTKQLT